MEATMEFLPEIPIPAPPFDVQKRIQKLLDYLDLNSSTSISKPPLNLYEDGKIDGVEQVYIMDGKVASKEEMFRGSSWS
jgi:restriction endonuclease S subunit